MSKVEWTAALRLAERRRFLPQNPSPDALALFKRWQAQAPFPSLWEDRLNIAGLSADLFVQLLDPSAHEHMEIPVWLAQFQACFAQSAPAYLNWMQEPSLLELVWPLVAWSKQQVEIRLAELTIPTINWAVFWHYATEQLAQHLGVLAGPTLVYELNVARLRQQLGGADSAARFRSFVARFRGDLPQLLQRYPLLQRLLIQACQRWTMAVSLLLERLHADWQTLVDTFDLDASTQLLRIQFGAGDTHAGESVSILHFDAGRRLVYKPQDLAVQRVFGHLVAWLNQHAPLPELRLPKLLERQQYGWVEFIETDPCHAQAEVERFYERHGAFLALFYLLQAADMHYENWIAAGEYPVPIDLEGLCQPPLGPSMSALQRVGLLPQQFWSNANQAGVDLSGLGGTAQQALPLKQPTWVNVNTDEMALVYTSATSQAAQNLPVLNQQTLDPRMYKQSFIKGFTHAYTTLLAYRSSLIADLSVLADFAEVQVRCILRPSENYAILLRRSYHPNLLRNAVERERLFDYLWLAVPQQPWLRAAILAEQEALWHGDIPWFGMRPNSRNLVTKEGTVLPNALPEAAWPRIQACLQQLSEQDLAEQIAFIEQSFASPK